MSKKEIEKPASSLDAIPNPLEKPEEFWKVSIPHGCNCMRNHFKIPAGSVGWVHKPMFAPVYRPDSDFGAMVFFWERHGYHEPARCAVPLVNISADKKTEKLIDEWRAAHAIKKEEKTADPGPASARKVLEENAKTHPIKPEDLPIQKVDLVVNEKFQPEVKFMKKANFSKAKGKFIVTMVEYKPDDKFELGILCVTKEGAPDANTGDPMTFDDEKSALAKVKEWGIEATETSEIVAMKIGKAV